MLYFRFFIIIFAAVKLQRDIYLDHVNPFHTSEITIPM